MEIPKLASKHDCTGCMVCVDSCKHSALEGYKGYNGHWYVKLHKEKCVQCGLCVKKCPIVSSFSYQRKDDIGHPYAVWANDMKLRRESTSGGAFAALATYVISIGGCVVGATMEGNQIRHLLINDIKDISKLQGSKYIQGNLTGIYLKVKSELEKKRIVLFSGTSCQVAALYSFLPHAYEGLLFTLDLICGGFPSSLALDKFWSNEPIDIQKITYRNKLTGWIGGNKLVVKTLDNQIIPYGKNVIYGAFYSGLTHRSSCHNCRFAIVNRKADLTVGDFWGDKDYPEEHYWGISVVVAHSKAGEKLLRLSNVTFHPSTWDKFLRRNFRMVCGKKRFLSLDIVYWVYPWLFHKCSYSTVKMVFGASEKVSLVWLIYKGCRRFIMWIPNKINQATRERMVCEVLEKIKVKSNNNR